MHAFYKDGRERQTSHQVELLSNHVVRIIFKLGGNDWGTGMNRICRTGAIAGRYWYWYWYWWGQGLCGNQSCWNSH